MTQSRFSPDRMHPAINGRWHSQTCSKASFGTEKFLAQIGPTRPILAGLVAGLL